MIGNSNYKILLGAKVRQINVLPTAKIGLPRPGCI